MSFQFRGRRLIVSAFSACALPLSVIADRAGGRVVTPDGPAQGSVALRPGGETFVERLVRTLDDGGVHQVSGRRPSRRPGPPSWCRRRWLPSRDSWKTLMPHVASCHRSWPRSTKPRRQGRRNAGHARRHATRAAETIAASIAAFNRGGAPIVRVTHDGRHGHPVIFAARVFEDLRAADISIGAKAVLRRNPGLVYNLEVDDPGILRDVDFAGDYRAAFGHDPE